MRIAKRVVLATVALIIVAAPGLIATQAQADPGDRITRFDVVATADKNGTLQVTQTIDVAFASYGHGPYVYFITRQGYNDKHDRLITYSNIKVMSPTRAPTNTKTTRTGDYMEIRIGDPDTTVRGTQTYVITYTVTGIVNQDVATPGMDNMDQIYWNVIGTGWQIPLGNISVTINTPSDVLATTCYTGRDYTAPCDEHRSSGATATYTKDLLQPGEGMAVVGGWPVGTYPGAKLNLVSTSQNPFDLVNGGAVPAGFAAALAALSGWLLTRLNKRGRDEQYANVTPGMVPVAGDNVEIKREEVRDAPVEYAPPRGIPPRLVGAVAREGTANQDVTASIIDLAVRGYVLMQQGERNSFSLTRTAQSPDTLIPVDRQIYDQLFGSSSYISSQDMADKDFYASYTAIQAMIKKEFDAQKWYRKNPGSVVAAYLAGGLVIAALGGVISILVGPGLAQAGMLGIGWLGLPFVILGVGVMILSRRMPVRTPLGSAVAIQALGFKKYLETAEADQIKWEEGQDIFSQYLPYAISFGCADRWAKVFEDLAARGAPVPEPTWYTGYAYGYPVWGSITHSVNNIGSSFASSVSAHAAATGGSGGGSGFSGGGFGGGVGGGGGGTW